MTIAIPFDFPVQPLAPTDSAVCRLTCGYCGTSWDDGKITGLTPAPSGRCPFEPFHIASEIEEMIEDDADSEQVPQLARELWAVLPTSNAKSDPYVRITLAKTRNSKPETRNASSMRHLIRLLTGRRSNQRRNSRIPWLFHSITAFNASKRYVHALL